MKTMALSIVLLASGCGSTAPPAPPPCDAAPLTLVRDASIYGLQASSDGNDVYFTEYVEMSGAQGDGSLWKVPIGGGATAQIWQSGGVFFGRGMAIDDEAVYWPGADQGPLGIFGVRTTDGTLVLDQPIDGTGMDVEVEQDDASVYASTSTSGIVKLPKAGGAATLLTPPSLHTILLAVDGGFVYFAPYDAAASTSSLYRVSTEGGAPAKLADLGPGGISAIAISGASVHVALSGTVLSVPVEGGTPVSLASPTGVYLLAADAQGLYAGASSLQDGALGAIWAIAPGGTAAPKKLADVDFSGDHGIIALDAGNVVWSIPGEVGRVGRCFH